MKSKTNATRKLNDTSWLAQIIKDKMDTESQKMGLYASARWNCLHTLHIIVNEADNPENDTIYYDTRDGKRQIIICDIPSLTKHGSDFDRAGMRSKLSGLAARYTDDEGMYLVSVLTTHDLNSATINDISELMYQLGTH